MLGRLACASDSYGVPGSRPSILSGFQNPLYSALMSCFFVVPLYSAPMSYFFVDPLFFVDASRFALAPCFCC